MIRKATAMTFRRNLGELLNDVQYRKGRIVITKGGNPVAALIDIALFERLRKLDEEFEQRRCLPSPRAFAGSLSPPPGLACTACRPGVESRLGVTAMSFSFVPGRDRVAVLTASTNASRASGGSYGHAWRAAMRARVPRQR